MEERTAEGAAELEAGMVEAIEEVEMAEVVAMEARGSKGVREEENRGVDRTG